MRAKFSRKNLIFLVFPLLVACASQLLEEDELEKFQTNEEFEQMVKIEEIKTQEKPELKDIKVHEEEKPKAELKPLVRKGEDKPKKPVLEQKKTKVKKEEIEKAKKLTRQPKHEDSDGFKGRRPLVDPFKVGEKITFAMKYFNVAAGYLTLETQPFVKVNDRKAYHFTVDIRSSKVFSYVYEVKDKAETFVDYETLLPSTMSIHVNESKQVKEIRQFFDWEKLKGSYWEKKITDDKGERRKKVEWDIEPFSQNVISAVFYVRNFQLEPGKTIKFYVADEGKNLLFSGNVLRREKLDTVIGELNTVVVQPKFTIDGVFKPVGDIYLWFTDDDHKSLVRIESKIKIGTLVGELKSLHR